MSFKNSNHNYKIGVQVVVNNKLDLTIGFINNFLEYFGNNDNIILLIIDNNSTDNTFEYIKNNFNNINIVRLNDNYGTTTGRNVGIVLLVESGCDFIYMSDNDVEFRDKNFFNKLLQFHDRNPEIDASCPVVRWFDGESIQTLGTREVRKNWFKNLSVPDGNIFINSLPGCAQFIKSTVIRKYGVFDNDLSPISIEDLEWGMRATRRGAKMAYVSDCEIYHKQKRNAINSHQKMEFVLKGRGVFIRKYFNLQCIVREFRNFIFCTKNYGLMFTIRSYKKGLTRKLEKDNYVFDNFKNTVTDYITERHTVSI